MRFLLVASFCLSVGWTLIPATNSAVASMREIVAVRLEQPLQIDGTLVEPLYQMPPGADSFTQMEPDNGRPATEATRVWIGYDDDALYVGAQLLDQSPDSIVTRVLRRDEGFESDGFSFAIDSYHDRRNAFWFCVNPSGSIQDGTIINDSRFDNSWNGIWSVRAARNGEGWAAEFRIPWSQLRFSAAAEQIWGIDFRRDIHRRHEASTFMPHPRNEQGVVSRFGLLTGIRDIKPSRRLEIVPYLTGSYGSLPSEDENPLIEGSARQFDTGLDLKVGIGSNLTVDAALNPDFGQVEVDPAEINLSAFETFYEEKRPFFIEGAGIFSFGRGGPSNRMNINFMEPVFFYSRRIGRAPQGEIDSGGWVDVPSATTILGAGKLSGRLGSWSLGCLTALTASEEAEIEEYLPESEFGGPASIRWRQEVEPLTWYGLLRTEREFADGRRGLGLLLTDVRRDLSDPRLREQLNTSATSFGLDGWSFLGAERSWAISAWGGLTDVRGNRTRITDLQRNSTHYFQRPDADHLTLDSAATSLTGWGGRLVLNKERGHLFLNGALGLVSPAFEPNDLGLSFRSDMINKHLTMGWRWYEPGPFYRFALLNGSLISNHNFNGTRLGMMESVFWYLIFPNFWITEGFVAYGNGGEDPSLLRGGPSVKSPPFLISNLNMMTDEQERLSCELNLEWSRNARWGGSIGVRSELALKLGSSFNLEVAPSYNHDRYGTQYVDSWADSAQAAMFGHRYLFARLDQKVIAAEIRFDWALTPRLSLQAFVQPFQAVGRYNSFREFRRPGSYDFLVYGEGEATIVPSGNWYNLDPTGGKDDDAVWIDNPDFNYKSFVANVVLRWEFRPGSTFYLVWTRNGEDDADAGSFAFRRDWRRLLTAETDNLFALKLSWWWGI